MIKDYKFLQVWKKYSNNRTSSLDDEVIQIKQGKSFLYLIPDGEKEYNECVRHFITIMSQEQFEKEFSLIKMFP
jgi:hypothetical protein